MAKRAPISRTTFSSEALLNAHTVMRQRKRSAGGS